ncbi:MAG: ParB/RepB/Spo0J family partition protein [Clostridiales bacterium]|nr:ParB/RepB/Spo0J family partition protein [Clostridiales bacterium]
MESIVKLNLKDIDPFKNHPFQVNNDESLVELLVSVGKHGIISPLIVREKSNNRFEMISGHRRKLALELLGIEEADAVVKNLSDDDAVIFMVDSNIYRETILPSEKAFAYKMKLEAIKHQGKLTSDPQGPKLSVESVGKKFGDSATNVKRYIRLTYLHPELLKLVDNTVKYGKSSYLTMGIRPAVELSYLSIDEQKLVYSSIVYQDLTPSHAQTIKIRELSKQKQLNYNSLENILCEKKGNQNETISFNKSKIESVLPQELLRRDKRYIEQYIIEAIENYKRVKKSEFEMIDLNRLRI